MQKNIVVTLLTLAFFFSACSSNKLIEIADDAECQTTIEGNFYSTPIYKYYSPAILFPKSAKVWIKYGSVIKKDENGVFFQEKKSGLFGSSDTLYFKYDEIRAIVDSNKHCVWGQLNENEKGGRHLKFTLKYLEDPEYAPIYLELSPDKNFAYCALPGNYEITNIIMDYPSDNKEIYYSSIPDRIARFEIKPNIVNYIGDIKLVNDNEFDKITLTIPYKEQSKGTSAASVGGLLGGALGGAIAGAITAAANESADSAGFFKFSIEHNKEYKPKLNGIVEKRIILPLE